jgi:small GTP-binding protein
MVNATVIISPAASQPGIPTAGFSHPMAFGQPIIFSGSTDRLPMATPDLPVQFKFIVIGASGSGKTSIVRRLCEGKYAKGLQSTVGIEYFTHVATVSGRTVKMMIWDTAGQERFYAVAKAYFRSAVGVILVFDIADRTSFDQLPRWLRDARTEADPHCTVYLVGNKLDLEQRRTVSRTEAENFAKTHKLQYIETSAAEIGRAHV